MFDFIRVATAVPDVSVADTVYNTKEIKQKINEAIEKNADFIIFPELSITGATCGDLFYQQALIEAAKKSLVDIMEYSENLDCIIALGMPISIMNRLYDCAVIISKGKINGIIPKAYNKNNIFNNADTLNIENISSVFLEIREEYDIPVGINLIFDINSIKFGIEMGDDLFSPIPPSTMLAINGAELILNLCAINTTVTSRKLTENLIKAHSQTQLLAYALVSAGASESTTDYVYSGHSIIAEKGRILAENDKETANDYLLINDIDIGKIKADKKHQQPIDYAVDARYIDIAVPNIGSDASMYEISPYPFIPFENSDCLLRCLDIFNMQVLALSKRIKITNSKMVIGVSGGLDSTLALLVAAKTAINMNRPLTDVIGITMPCFGTSDRTYNNSLKLMQTLGITTEEINIKNACIEHFKDIGHDINIHDLTYENTQARERTQVLMDYSGKVGGLVVGTGDLSELALGWCTYNGDHMSMYGVNSGVPKTLIPYIIASIIKSNIFPDSTEVLKDIVDTPISPELLPPDENGNISQVTQDIVGPYELHDFFLYYILRYAFEPKKIYFLAKLAFKDSYDDETILKWLKNFYRRFFTQQFKRSCMADGVKIGSVCLSPRGALKMPSDASAKIWLDEVEKL